MTFTQTSPTPTVSTDSYSGGGTDLVLFLPNDVGQIAAYTYRR